MDRNNNNVRWWIAGFIILAIGFQPETLASPSPTGADHSTKARLVETYGKLPLSFEANQGQTGDQVRFLSRGPGYSVFLTPTEAVVALHKTTASRDKPSEKPLIPGKAAGRDPESRDIQAQRDLMPASAGMTQPASRDHRDRDTQPRSVLRMQLVGANPKPRISGGDPLPGKVNYFRGNKPKQWRTNIPTYAKVKYENVYPGIDLVYYGNQRQLEHDFVVAPGADPGTIRLAFAGAERIAIDGQGDLVLTTASGDVRLQKPLAYQNINGNHHKIPGRYVLHSGKRKDKQQIGFQVAAYDKGKPLIIDPVLVYSTYLGGSGDDFGHGIAVDNQGNAYVTGTTYFSDFPVTAGAFQTSFNGGGSDVFIAKFNAAGSALVYSTYLGGSRDDLSRSGPADTPRSIAVDNDGNAYVTGQTSSPDFPVTAGAFQTTLNATGAFVTKLNASGSALVYSTYLSGSGVASGSSIIIDTQGNAYVTGYAYADFPATSVFGVVNSDTAAFVTKFNADGSALVYSALLGGTNPEYGIGIALDSVGDVYVTGQTGSADFPIVNALYASFNGQTAFVTKLNPSGSGILWSTYVPTAAGTTTAIYGVTADSTDDVYLTGRTTSPDFPTTPGAFDTSYNGGDAIVMKLNSFGSQVLYSTFLGGSGDDTALSIVVDTQGNAYLTGNTDSSDFPVTAGAIDATFGGGFSDAFVTKLNASGSALAYSTYLGGSFSDAGHSIALDSVGNAYIVGDTNSFDFSTTAGAFDTTAPVGGLYDVFVVKISDTAPPPPQPVLSVTPVSLDFGTVTVGGSKDLEFTATNTGDGTLTGTASASAPFSIVSGGSYSLGSGASQVVVVRFAPAAPGSFTGNVSFASNGSDTSQVVTGTGEVAPPAIIGLSSTSGPEGATITIGGSNFGSTQNSSSVNVCGVDAQVGHWEDTLIAIVVPSLTVGTECSLFVTTPAGSSNSVNFTVIAPSTISGFLRTDSGTGINNAQVVVAAGASGMVKSNRTGFYSKSGLANGQFNVRPVRSGFLFIPETQIIDINGSSRTDVNFIGAAVVPVISSMKPKQGTNGTQVTISGSGFGSFDADIDRVKFGSVDAAIQSWDNKKIVVLSPSGDGSVLVTVTTASGTSNSEPFSYQPPVLRNVRLVPSGDFGVLVFNNLQTIASDPSRVIEEIAVENVSGAWYVVHVSNVGGITGPDLPAGDFMIGPFQTISLGQVTFPKKSQLLFLADNSIDLGSCIPVCDLQTRRILGVLAGELVWRVVTGEPFPVDDISKILEAVDLQTDSPLVDLGIDIWEGDILSIANDIPRVLEDPAVVFLLAKHNISVPTLSWILLYTRAAQVARLLIDTLLYPHVGQLAFNAR